MENHVRVIGILWIASGILTLLIAFLVFGILFGISFIPDVRCDSPEAPVILRTVGIAVGLFLAFFSVPQIIGGSGLLKHSEWARVLIIIISMLALLKFPLGTALGIYSIVILLKDETVKLFKTG